MDRDERPDRGFRQIGSLATEALPSLSPRDETMPGSVERARAAEITTSPRETSLPTLTRRGGPGSETPRALTLAEAAQRNDPQALDQAIVRSLPPSVASGLTANHRDFIDPVYGFDSEFVGYSLPREGVVSAELMQARQLVGQHLRPAAGSLIKQELARLRVSTKARPQSADDMVMGFQVLAEECSEYPADVVVWALRGWAGSEVFYPSLAEIRDRLQRGARRRKALMTALSRETA